MELATTTPPMAMDWYSWLRKASFEPSRASDYALLFSQNELEEADVAEFDHEFLKSMGISIAKHRLQILKLARKEKKVLTKPMFALFSVMGKARRSISRRLIELVKPEKNAIVLVKLKDDSREKKAWKEAILKKNNGLMTPKQGRLMITNGDVPPFTSPVYGILRSNGGYKKGGGGGGDDDKFKWDSMFANLKPT